VDIDRAADLYAQGWTLRQIGAELSLSEATLSDQLRRAGVTMRRGAPAHPASTQQVVELRDQGLTWNEIAEQVDMTVSGVWSRHRRARPPKPPRLGRWQQVLADALDQNLAVGVRAAVADHLGRTPTRAELTAARRAAHSLAKLGRARVLHVAGAGADDNAGDRTYLVLAKPNVIMTDIRLRGLAVAGSDAAGRKSPHNHTQTVRNLRRSLRNAAELRTFGMTFASAKLDLEWALANLERAIALAGAPKLGEWVVERLVDLVASRPAVATRILAAMLEHPENEWDHIGWRDEARAIVERAIRSGDPAAVDSCRSIVDNYVRRGELDFRELLDSSRDLRSVTEDPLR
jgi:hypothetical protein